MTREEAEAWLIRVGGKFTNTNTIEGAKSLPEAAAMAQMTICKITVDDRTVAIVVPHPPPSRDILRPFLAQYWCQIHDDHPAAQA
jgi:hypothetical protein